MATLRLFAQAREAAGGGSFQFDDAATVADVLAEASERFGERFDAIVAKSKVWLNGDECRPGDPVTNRDEVAVLPPVSGG
jgi:molybdopterin converting factor small subunit